MDMEETMFKIECALPNCDETEYFIDTGDYNFKKQMILRAGWLPYSIDVETTKISYMCKRCAIVMHKKYFDNNAKREIYKKTQKIPIPPVVPPATSINDGFFSLEFNQSYLSPYDACENGYGFGWGAYAG